MYYFAEAEHRHALKFHSTEELIRKVSNSFHYLSLLWSCPWGKLIIILVFLLLLAFCIKVGQRRQWHPTPVFLPGKSHGQRSLEGCSPWGRWGSDTTERLHFHFSLSCIGEGNGNPLQCSCLENLRDRGVWWAAISLVTQSQTRLKWLSNLANKSREKYFLHF